MRDLRLRGRHCSSASRVLVPTVGFEPTRLAALAPQASVSTNSTTSALSGSRAFPGRHLGAGTGAGAGVEGGVEAGGGVTGNGAAAPVADLPFSAASSRIVFSWACCRDTEVPRYASHRLLIMNIAANTAVVRDSAVVAPRAPNTVPDAPAPKPAPASAPLPR